MCVTTPEALSVFFDSVSYFLDYHCSIIKNKLDLQAYTTMPCSNPVLCKYLVLIALIVVENYTV
ncbi:Uncharacterised protein [Chlamydia trachomatis]|nr:Uncharacterised protein [Chlamydia trachomatis]